MTTMPNALANRTWAEIDACRNLETPVGDSLWHAILLPSGRVDDIAGDHEDAVLMRETAALLSGLGVATTIVVLPTERSLLSFTSEALHRERMKCAAAAVMQVAPDRGVAIFGHSLGGTTALMLANASPCRSRISSLTLIGTVIENPRTVSLSIAGIDLLYGARDHITYVDDDIDSEVKIIPASKFGYQSADKLILASRQCVRVTIIDGIGHSMRATAAADDEGPFFEKIRAIVQEWLKTDSKDGGNH